MNYKGVVQLAAILAADLILISKQCLFLTHNTLAHVFIETCRQSAITL